MIEIEFATTEEGVAAWLIDCANVFLVASERDDVVDELTELFREYGVVGFRVPMSVGDYIITQNPDDLAAGDIPFGGRESVATLLKECGAQYRVHANNHSVVWQFSRMFRFRGDTQTLQALTPELLVKNIKAAYAVPATRAEEILTRFDAKMGSAPVSGRRGRA